MNLAPLLRLLASLCIFSLLALPGCMKGAPAKSGSSSPPAEAAQPMATRGDYGTRSNRGYGGSADDGYAGDYAESAQSEPAPRSSAGAAPTERYEMRDYEEAPAADYDSRARVSAARRHKPGLGTEYGEQHRSHVTTAPFVRGASRPDVMLALWYNDPEGVRLAQGAFGQVSQTATSDGAFVVSVVDEYGYALSAAQVGDKRYVVGEPGQRYRLQIQNNSAYRYEIVASVDGLDVIDGKTASVAKRGYIIEPWSSIHIDGWRTGNDSIAAFRFSAMEDSYAERKGQGRNIGVMGFAFFHERGGRPWAELHRRDNADPFPGRYAEPPPPRGWR